MSRFAPDLAKVKAGFRILSAGEWELAIGKPTAIFYIKDATDKKPAHEVAGCRYMMSIIGQIKADGSIDEEFKDDAVTPFRLYVHNEKAHSMTKQWILAALGYSIDEEAKADKEYFDKADFSIDVDDNDEGVLGKSWHDLEGKRIRMTAQTSMFNDRESQDWKSYLPA